MEETIAYEDYFSAEEWDSQEVGSWGPEPPRRTSLPERDALRIAKALDDYELVSVTDIGGSNCFGFWVLITDQRYNLDYEICSHADYWDFISYFAAGQQWPVKPYRAGGHRVSVAPKPEGFELSCDACDFDERTDSAAEAEALKRLHEAFIAKLVDRFEVA